MTFIYRIENIYGDGPILNKLQLNKNKIRNVWYKYHYLSDKTERRMHPDCDCLITTDLGKFVRDNTKLRNKSRYIDFDGYKFGFKNIDDLQIYFLRHEIRDFEKIGFFVYKIRINSCHVINGSRQLIYKKYKEIEKHRIQIFRR